MQVRQTGTCDAAHWSIHEFRINGQLPFCCDFDSTEGRIWGPSRFVSYVPRGAGPNDHCLQASHTPTAAAHYLVAHGSINWVATRNSRLAFDYCTEAAVPGKRYYFKITLRDAQAENWSAIISESPTRNWRRENIAFSRFTRDNGKRWADRLPPGTAIQTLIVYQRKGEAKTASAHRFRLDNIRLYEEE